MKQAYLILGLLLSTAVGAAERKQKNKTLLDQTKSGHDYITGQGYGTAGCGLGSIVFGEKPGMVQIFAATTNGISGNQTFGISSGTLNCDDQDNADTATVSARVNYLVLANRNRMESEAAQGAGESIAALATIGKCSSAAHLGENLQQQFATVFAQPGDHHAITARLLPVMKNSDCQL